LGNNPVNFIDPMRLNALIILSLTFKQKWMISRW